MQTSVPAAMTVHSIGKDSDFAGQVNTVHLNFTTVHSIPLNGVIRIEYPRQVAVQTDSFDVSSNLASRSMPELYQQDRTVLVTGLFTTVASSGGTNVEISINGIVNSLFAAQTDSFVIESYTDSTLRYVIDKVDSGLALSNN